MLSSFEPFGSAKTSEPDMKRETFPFSHQHSLPPFSWLCPSLSLSGTISGSGYFMTTHTGACTHPQTLSPTHKYLIVTSAFISGRGCCPSHVLVSSPTLFCRTTRSLSTLVVLNTACCRPPPDSWGHSVNREKLRYHLVKEPWTKRVHPIIQYNTFSIYSCSVLFFL